MTRYSTLSIVAALSSLVVAQAPANVSTSIEVVTAYTTVCPSPTSFTEGTQTYIVTEPTTLTVTDCPCTRTHTFYTEYVTVCASGTPVASAEVSQPATASGSSPQVANTAGVIGWSLAAVAGAGIVALL